MLVSEVLPPTVSFFWYDIILAYSLIKKFLKINFIFYKHEYEHNFYYMEISLWMTWEEIYIRESNEKFWGNESKLSV